MIPRPTVLLLLLLACLLVAPVAAESEIVVDEDLFEFVDFSIGETTQPTGDGFTYDNDPIKVIRIKDITHFEELSYIVVSVAENGGQWGNGTIMETGRHDFTYSFNGKTRPGVVYVERYTNVVGTVTQSRFTIFLNDWDIGELTGEQSITLPFSIQHENGQMRIGSIWRDNPLEIMFTAYPHGVSGEYEVPKYVRPIVSYSGGVPWRNHLTVTKVAEGDAQVPGFSIDLARRIYGLPYTSTLSVLSNSATVYTSTKNGINENLWYAQTSITDINITSPSGKTYSFPLKQYMDINGAIIYGDVLDVYTGDPISGATITLTQTYPGTTHEATSDASGYRTDAPVTHGLPITITASATGYYDACYSFQAVPPYAEWYVPILMVPDAPPDVPTEPEKSMLYGYILTQGSQQPISGATVSLDGYGSTTTSSTGFYLFNNIDPGQYTISASAPLHDALSEPVTVETVATPYNLALKGHFLLTVTGKDDTSLANVQNATISLSDGQESTTNPATFNVDYGPYTITAAAGGYYPQTQSAYLDKPGTTTATVLMTAIAPTPTPPEIPNYPPHNVKFTVQTLLGTPIPGVTVTAQGIQQTPSTNILERLLGINTTSTPITTELMSGTTDSNGEINFMMIEAVKYQITIKKPGVVDQTLEIYPKEDTYPIIISTAGGPLLPDAGDALRDIHINVTTSTEGDIGHIHIDYNDTTRKTTSLTIQVTQQNTTDSSAPEEVIASHTVANDANVTHTFDLPNYKGQSFFVRLEAEHPDFGTVHRDYAVAFKGVRVPLGPLPDGLYIYVAGFSLMLLGGIFGATSATRGVVVIAFAGWLFYAFGWLDDLGLIAPVSLGLVSTLAVMGVIVTRYREEGYT